jgi:hypothetical protein
MANGAMIITWGSTVRGREMKGLEVFGKSLAFYDELAKEGRIHGHREYIAVSGNVSERAGTVIVGGELEELAKLQVSEESTRLLGEAAQICDNMTVQLFETANDEAIGRYVTLLQDMGLGG